MCKKIKNFKLQNKKKFIIQKFINKKDIIINIKLLISLNI